MGDSPDRAFREFRAFTSLAVGVVFVFASQIEVFLRSGDHSFWGFVVMVSVIAGVVFGFVAQGGGVIAGGFERIRMLPATARPFAVGAVMAAAVIAATALCALVLGSALWLTSAICVVAIAVCALIAAVPESEAKRRRRERGVQL